MTDTETTLKAIHSTKHRTNFVTGCAYRIVRCAALFLVTCTASAFAQESGQGTKVAHALKGSAELTTSTFDLASLPSLDSIDAQTDIIVFLQNGVPPRMRIAALRRAWSSDPAIRDFKGLQESDWNFDDPDGIPGFGELDPRTDIKLMVAELFSETPHLAARPPRQRVLLLGLFGLQ